MIVLEPATGRIHRHSASVAYQLCRPEKGWTCDGFPSTQPQIWHEENGGYWQQEPDKCDELGVVTISARVLQAGRWHTTDLWTVCRAHQARAAETDYCSLVGPHDDCMYPAWPEGPSR